MATNFTPWVPGVTKFKASEMNAPLGQLDTAIENLKTSKADLVHTHDDRYYTETELNTSGGGGQVHWDNVTNKPTLPTTAPVVVGVSFQKGQKPDAGAEINFPSPIAFTLPIDLAGAKYKASGTPTGQVVVSIKKSGTEIGTMTVNAGSSSATFASTAGSSITTNDSVDFVYPATQDATWAGVCISLLGTRTI